MEFNGLLAMDKISLAKQTRLLLRLPQILLDLILAHHQTQHLRIKSTTYKEQKHFIKLWFKAYIYYTFTKGVVNLFHQTKTIFIPIFVVNYIKIYD